MFWCCPLVATGLHGVIWSGMLFPGGTSFLQGSVLLCHLLDWCVLQSPHLNPRVPQALLCATEVLQAGVVFCVSVWVPKEFQGVPEQDLGFFVVLVCLKGSEFGFALHP